MPRLVMLLFALFVLSVRAHAQETRAPRPGVRFEQGLSWRAARAKAKQTQKPILLVATSTTCERCTAMEQMVYPQPQVADFLNDKFLALKVQLDTTPSDPAAVKRWYAAARQLRQQYRITVYPTFLFFSPEGRLVHRGQGSKGAEALLALAAEALNPATQYYTLLASYQRGHKDVAGLRELGRMATALGDTATVHQVADDYLAQLDSTERYAKAHLEFLRSVTRRSTARAFALFHRSGTKVDSVLGAGAAQSVVDGIITQEEIRPSVVAAKQGGPAPDWRRITAAIAQKYGAETAERTVLVAQVGWYRAQQDWPKYIAHLVLKMERYPPGEIGVGFFAAMGLNNAAWDVFEHSSDPAILAKALAWSDRAVKASPGAGMIDTYANLLYKLGRVEEARLWQEVAVKLEPKNAELAATLEKMERGEPTWPEP